MSGDKLHRAVSMNDIDAVIHILRGRQVLVHSLNKLGYTPLMVASQKGYTRLVEVLIENGSDVNQKNSSGKDSLMIACFSGHLDIVKTLRSKGASWEAKDLGGCTAMHWAADGGHSEVIEWMINDGCEVDTRDIGLEWTPLMRLCAMSGKVEVATLFLDAGADVNLTDKDGKTPLMIASLNNHDNLVSLLLERGADVDVKNEYGKGALEMARGLNRTSVIQIIEDKMSRIKLEQLAAASGAQLNDAND